MAVISFTFAQEEIIFDVMKQANKFTSEVQRYSLARHRYANKQSDHWIAQATHGKLGS